MKSAVLSLFALLLLLAGCASPSSISSESAGRFVTAAPNVGKVPSWEPTAVEISTLEQKLAALLRSPDERIFGLGQTLPPHPLSTYFVRYTAAGPLDNKYIIGQAALSTATDSATFLSPATNDTDAVAAVSKTPGNFSFIYDMKKARIMELRYTPALAAPSA